MRRIAGVSLAAALLVAVVSLAGCASMDTREWTGHPIAEVIKEFGTPTRTVPSADGSTMYMWERRHSIPQSSWGGSPGSPTVVTSSRTQTTTWTFWVNQAGMVVSWNRHDDSMS